eukprot:TRINITY_DN5303_c0_g1_i2.p1 TRINITY_DN5303_c0_g1~~TRINITY_DN5303_c0_g1_i2.p1  ORF type:complete len:224 (+),score=32.25 TRINITY_DN5303_c0_g1_i2:87-758(+)
MKNCQLHSSFGTCVSKQEDRTQRIQSRGDMVGCLRECESDHPVLMIRNTFLEWVLPVQGKRRPSSSPPTCRFRSTSPASVQSALEMKQSPSPSPASMPPQNTMLHGVVDNDYGYHPSHPLWIGQAAIMLRNIPCRCKADEIKNIITAGGVPSEKWTMTMPAGSYGRNRGYAFITATDPATAMELVHVLWKRTIPTRVSQRPLKLQPAFEDLSENKAPSFSLSR